MTAVDVQFLRRAIRIAMNGRGRVEPNPMVGCVLVKKGQVIGEGFHSKIGHPHAEPTALANCTESPAGATAYVTLEPCCHIGKKTPPCAPRLIREKIARVVVGCLDPNPEVNGGGVQMLRDAGVIVDVPLLEPECKQLIAPFTRGIKTGLPYITLKWAQTADGKVAGAQGKRMQISNAVSNRVVGELRSHVDAIAVGIKTVLNDDPILLPRAAATDRPYRRYVLDSRLRTPVNSKLVETIGQGAVTLFCTNLQTEGIASRKNQLLARGVRIIDEFDEDIGGHISLDQWIKWLKGETISHLLVEPGPMLARAMLPSADRLWVVRSPKRVDDESAPAAADIPDGFVQTGQLQLDDDVLTEYLNSRGDAFFTAAESADLVLSRELSSTS